jgi:hypothetical protein
MEKNLTTAEAETEINLFMAYNAAKTSFGCPSDYNAGDLEWCKRNYISRTEKTVQPVDENSIRQSLSIGFIPGNPGYVSISVNLPAPDLIDCFLYDITGRMIQIVAGQSVESEGNYRFPVPQLPQGIYLFKVSVKTGLCTTGKILMN